MRTCEERMCPRCGNTRMCVHKPAPVPPTANEAKLRELAHKVRVESASLRLAKAKMRMAQIAVDTERAEIALSAASLNASHFGIKDADDCPPALPVPSDNGWDGSHKSVFGE